jgi:hypothetical protein
LQTDRRSKSNRAPWVRQRPTLELGPENGGKYSGAGRKKIDAAWKIMDALAAPMILASAATEGYRKGGS